MFDNATLSAAPAAVGAGGGGGGAAIQPPPSLFAVSDRQRAFSAQARWVVYSRQLISFAAFDDEYFKDMLRAVGGAGAAILTKELLKKYIEAEFAIFLICLKLICTLKMVQSHGTPSVQAVHDGATAANKKKYQALAVQLVDPRWKRNLVICVGFVAALLSTAPDVAALFNTILIERTGYALISLCGLMVSDRAALAVSVKAGIDEAEACDMHDGDKVGEAATGKLTRSRMGVCVNPFQTGVTLLQKAHRMAVVEGVARPNGNFNGNPGLGLLSVPKNKIDHRVSGSAACFLGGINIAVQIAKSGYPGAVHNHFGRDYALISCLNELPVAWWLQSIAIDCNRLQPIAKSGANSIANFALARADAIGLAPTSP